MKVHLACRVMRRKRITFRVFEHRMRQKILAYLVTSIESCVNFAAKS